MKVRTVVKVGGGLLSQAGAFDLVTGALAAFAKGQRALIVPGGGPFADAVRELARRIKITEDAAHWMAVLGMDQYAQALAARTTGAVVVESLADTERALASSAIPVLAPYRWLREADPLPHSWGTTSDSIAAWVAGVVGAKRIVLIKPVKASVGRVVDPNFTKTLPAGVDTVVLTPHELEKLSDALDGRADGGGPRAAHYG
ncbi:MAG TPA: hypothetical protein VLV16_09815 [Gemmatimonadales bacterium]|nr:hypothetical protein [Gemmatimonadales bacterium]